MAQVTYSEGFTFDDVLLRPRASRVEPGSASLKTTLYQGGAFALPFLSAAMDKVTGAQMAISLGRAGGLGVLHRNCTIAEQCRMVRQVKKAKVRVAAACGPFDLERAQALKAAGVDIVSIDCAHGHNLNVLASAARIKRAIKIPLIVGNIATAEGARAACRFADAVKVGVGPGSICTTRIISGVGVPQLSAILEVVAVAKKFDVPVIADGGMRTSGDIAKALAAGASAVMLGNLLAGTLETPGRVITKGGTRYKEYRGMGSRAVIGTASAAGRYMTKGRALVPEGVEALVPYRGPVAEVAAELASGVQVAMGYVGAADLAAFAKRADFIRISPSTVLENGPHSLASYHR